LDPSSYHTTEHKESQISSSSSSSLMMAYKNLNFHLTKEITKKEKVLASSEEKKHKSCQFLVPESNSLSSKRSTQKLFFASFHCLIPKCPHHQKTDPLHKDCKREEGER
jgi:hypothetical protein